MITVPFLNLQPQHEQIKAELLKATESCLDSGVFILGQSVESFEKTWADYTGSDWSIGVSNGLDAIVLALRACNIGPGDEVIVPAQTFIATWLAVSLVGAKPVAVDVEETTANINPRLVKEVITPSTRAILAVHLFGQLANMQSLSEIAKNHGLFLIEDAAQAHGSKRDGRMAGFWSDLATYSFYPGKNLGALGDAGGITGKSLSLRESLLTLRNYGSKVKYVHDQLGYNSRLDPLQARFLEIKCKSLDNWNQHRKQQAETYLELLNNVPQLKLPHVEKGCEPCWHLFVVKTPLRESLQTYLKQQGIETLIHYPIPPYLQKAYKTHHHLNFPVAHEWALQSLSLPLGPHMTAESQAYVCEQICQFFKTQ